MKILDTNVISGFQKKTVDPRLKTWLAAHDPADLTLAAPVIAEIRFGQALLPHGHLAASLEKWLRQLYDLWIILPLDAMEADHLGRIWAIPALKNLHLSQTGQKRLQTGGDLMIAAIALANDAVVTTRNAADFEQIAACFPALKIENPFEAVLF